MKRKLVIAITCLIVAVGGAYALMISRSSQRSLAPEETAGAIGVLPVVDNAPLVVEPLPGLRFLFDSGSDISTITEADLQKLRDLGMEVTESTYPIAGYNDADELVLETKRYTVTLPLYRYKSTTDSTGAITASAAKADANLIHGVDFAPSRTGHSVLGVDFLQKFSVEYRFLDQAIALYLTPPAGYTPCLPLDISYSPSKTPWLGRRYYATLGVHDTQRPYFLDTGIRVARVKMPQKHAAKRRRMLRADSLYRAEGAVPALVEDDVTVLFGDRVTTAQVVYADTPAEGYAFNPIDFFMQDVLISSKTMSISLRPTFNIPARTPAPVARVVLE